MSTIDVQESGGGKIEDSSDYYENIKAVPEAGLRSNHLVHSTSSFDVIKVASKVKKAIPLTRSTPKFISMNNYRS